MCNSNSNSNSNSNNNVQRIYGNAQRFFGGGWVGPPKPNQNSSSFLFLEFCARFFVAVFAFCTGCALGFAWAVLDWCFSRLSPAYRSFICDVKKPIFGQKTAFLGQKKPNSEL
jgi:predicted membrane metal-binding protein